MASELVVDLRGRGRTATLLGVWVGNVRGRGQGMAPSTQRGSSVDTCLGRVGRSRDGIE